ncbi:SoxW family protein [Actibacterium sp. XHP0104]|uniref:SoxW family protein n=1 Tax=Actibacterium sp. XHP0104 TaxID=2984335 RepID=UPI0021E84B91|nr:thioredoxin family protein [Actibacterium sp. XHP0104]MCV2881471.1 thioredoxin family protein [Actibacterium sp. XHP0104]
MTKLTLTLAALLALALPALAGPPMGDDGLHKPVWLEDTFKDMSEDFASAQDQGKRLLIIWEQRGCLYCKKMHTEVFPDPAIQEILTQNYFIVQMNLFGDVEVTDFDGTTLSEKEMARRWGVMFTPTMMFMPDSLPEGGHAGQAAVAVMPGAFGKGTTTAILNWVLEKGYEGDEHLQKYIARTVYSAD